MDLSTLADELSAFLNDHVGCALYVDTYNVAIAYKGSCGGSLPRRAEWNGEDWFLLITLSDFLFAVDS